MSQFQEEALDSNWECKYKCCSIKHWWCRVGWLWHSLASARQQPVRCRLSSTSWIILKFPGKRRMQLTLLLLSHDNISRPPSSPAARWSYFSNSPVVLSPFVPLFWLHPRECREIDSNWFFRRREEAVGIQGKEQEKTEMERYEPRGVGPRA